MQDYLFNVGIDFAGYVGAAIVVLFIGYVATRAVFVNAALKGTECFETHIVANRVRLCGWYVAIAILVVGLILSTTSPSNTFKNEVHDPAARQKQIQAVNQEKRATVKREVVDISRQPDLTREERAAIFSTLTDYKNRDAE